MPYSFTALEERAEGEPLLLLHEFVDQTWALITNLVRGTVHQYDFRPDLGDELSLFETALSDAEEKDAPGALKESLRDANLPGAGLTGRSLSAKLGLLESFSDRLRKGLRKALTYILDMVNAVLGSIKAATGPAGLIADVLAELKDMIKAKIDLANGW